MAHYTAASSKMLYQLGAALSSTKPLLPLEPNPSLWIEENTGNIKTALEEVPVFPISDIPGFGEGLYPRIMAYAYARLKLLTSEEECAAFIESHSEWVSMGVIAQIAHNDTIRETLRVYLRKCGMIRPADRDHIVQMHRLDIQYLMARMIDCISKPEQLQLLVNEIGTTAQSLLDILQAILDSDYVDDARPLFLRAILKLVKKSELFPSSLLLDNVERSNSYASERGGFSDIWEGVYSQNNVAIKVMRIGSGGDDDRKKKKMFVREAVLWRQLRHPNVLPFFGIHNWPQGSQTVICLVSPWMGQGDIITYLGANPTADRSSLILDVANGLKYLHEFNPCIIHGDLKGPNILITPSSRACLADFGLYSLEQDHTCQFTSTTIMGLGTLAYIAPELLTMQLSDVDAQVSLKTSASDIYSFGIVVYEIFTSQSRYHQYRQMIPLINAIQKNCPTPRPDSINITVWELVERCWETNPEKRPTIQTIVDVLSSPAITLTKSCEWDLTSQDFLQPPLLDPNYMLPEVDVESMQHEAETKSSSLLHERAGDTHRLTLPSVSGLLSDTMPKAYQRFLQNPITSYRAMGQKHPEAREIRIMMIGETGVGKSTFIMRAAGMQLLSKDIIGHNILPFTKIVEEFEIKDTRRQAEQRIVRLVDTPGLNDTYVPDDHQLSTITKWLQNKSRHDRQATIDGVIYLCDINHRSLASINVKLSQPPVVLFVVVKENEIKQSIIESRQAALTMKFSQFAVDYFDDTTESAWRLIDRIIALSSTNQAVSLSAFQSNLESIFDIPKPVKKKKGTLRGFSDFLLKTG